MSESINVQNAPKLYQSYLKQAIVPSGDNVKNNINEEGQAKNAATAFCAKKPEADCQKFLQFLDVYGYKFNSKDIIIAKNEDQQIMAPTSDGPDTFNSKDNKYYKEWQLEIGLGGAILSFGDSARYNGVSTDLVTPKLYYPGIGVIYRPSYSSAVALDIRSLMGLTPISFSLETALQYKHMAWHKIHERGYDEARVNLGIGPVAKLNLYRDNSSLEGNALLEQSPSLKDRVILGGRLSVELEIEQDETASFEVSQYTNSSGESFFEAGIYIKLFYPRNPMVEHIPCIPSVNCHGYEFFLGY